MITFDQLEKKEEPIALVGLGYVGLPVAIHFAKKYEVIAYDFDQRRIQELKEVTLIRHAYILTSYQRKGVGKKLLKYLLEKNQSTCLLVGTWKAASWAIRFYEKFGFILLTKKQAFLLLKKYWRIPLNQMNNSVVLEK